MSGASSGEDAVDEVKVYRDNDNDDSDLAQTSQELTEEKKEVALETELETRPGIPAFNFFGHNPLFLSPNFQSLSPSYGIGPMIMPLIGQCAFPQFNRGGPLASPSYGGYLFSQMSPSFNQFAFGPGSPLHGGVPKVPLSATNIMRGMGTPLNQMNHMRLQPNVGGVMGVGGGPPPKKSKMDRKKEEHIKKPLNAFMWFMKKNRQKLLEEPEYRERQSAELNKELGRRWRDLGQEEQQKYFDMAKKAKDDHQQKYPNWTARENYALHKKKKRKREKSVENSEQKKCRARYGVQNQEQWCKHCRRKKRCLYYRETTSPVTTSSPHVSSTTHAPTASTPADSPASAQGSSSNGGGRDDDSDIDSDIEGEDPVLAQQILDETAPVTPLMMSGVSSTPLQVPLLPPSITT
uniref:dTCF n=1 Tax=Steinernema glaseri TaxID=37863 RepID=A0A1I7ZW57_9BILA